MKKFFLTLSLLLVAVGMMAVERQKLNFNADWRLFVGDVAEAKG